VTTKRLGVVHWVCRNSWGRGARQFESWTKKPEETEWGMYRCTARIRAPNGKRRGGGRVWAGNYKWVKLRRFDGRWGMAKRDHISMGFGITLNCQARMNPK